MFLFTKPTYDICFWDLNGAWHSYLLLMQHGNFLWMSTFLCLDKSTGCRIMSREPHPSCEDICRSSCSRIIWHQDQRISELSTALLTVMGWFAPDCLSGTVDREKREKVVATGISDLAVLRFQCKLPRHRAHVDNR